jgi:hypothetical protein
VCARVAIAQIKLLCRDKVIRAAKPPIVIGIAVGLLDGLQFKSLRSAYMSLNVWCLENRKSFDWLTGVLYRDMMGYSIRRCYFDAYKATRRDPRVTNRGVTQRAFQQQSGETDDLPSDKRQVSDED